MAVLFSVAGVAAVITTLISLNIIAVAAPTFASGKLIASRTGQQTEDLQDPVKRVQYISAPTVVIDANPKLKEVLAGADANYEILAKSKGYSQAVDSGYDVSITEEANTLISLLPELGASQEIQDNYVGEYHYFKLENEGKYYSVTIMTVGTQ